MSGDFNIDLLKIDSDKDIMSFYNSLTSNLFVPHITLPTRITSHSQTSIDNIFSNDPDFAQGISGNFTFSISGHLAQFLIIPKADNRPPKKHNIQVRDLKTLEVINIKWNEVISTDKADTQHSFELFDQKMNNILDKRVPLKKINKKELRLRTKPWITHGLIKSIKETR